MRILIHDGLPTMSHGDSDDEGSWMKMTSRSHDVLPMRQTWERESRETISMAQSHGEAPLVDFVDHDCSSILTIDQHRPGNLGRFVILTVF